MRGKKPVAKIVAIDTEPSRKALAGAYAGRGSWKDDAFDPLTDRELIELGWGYMVDAPLATPETPQE